MAPCFHSVIMRAIRKRTSSRDMWDSPSCRRAQLLSLSLCSLMWFSQSFLTFSGIVLGRRGGRLLARLSLSRSKAKSFHFVSGAFSSHISYMSMSWNFLLQIICTMLLQNQKFCGITTGMLSETTARVSWSETEK